MNGDPLPNQIKVYNCDFREAGRKIKDETADVIFTDPPFGQEFLPSGMTWGRSPSRVLKPGALLVTYTGQAYLGQVIADLSQHLSYVWCLAIVHDHRQSRIHHKRVINCLEAAPGLRQGDQQVRRDCLGCVPGQRCEQGPSRLGARSGRGGPLPRSPGPCGEPGRRSLHGLCDLRSGCTALRHEVPGL